MYQRKLKNYLLYPKLQLTLIVVNVLVSTFTLVIIYLSVNDVFSKLKNMGQQINLPENHAYFNFVIHSKELMSFKLSWALGFSFFLTTITSIYISHKIVGPIYKLRKFLIDVDKNGVTEEFQSRNGDYFEDLPEIVNKVILKRKD